MKASESAVAGSATPGLLRIDCAKLLIFIETIIKLHKKFTLMWGERGEKLGEASGGMIFFD